MCVGLGIELQYFCGTARAASILSSIEKCQVSEFGTDVLLKSVGSMSHSVAALTSHSLLEA